MSGDCLFCGIVAGKSPSTKFYEDDDFVVINNIHPVVDGHMLVIPKKHYDGFLDIPEELYGKVLVAVRKVVGERGIKDFNLVLNNGKVAGQLIGHFHLHILPRKEGDGFVLNS